MSNYITSNQRNTFEAYKHTIWGQILIDYASKASTYSDVYTKIITELVSQHDNIPNSLKDIKLVIDKYTGIDCSKYSTTQTKKLLDKLKLQKD